MTATTAPESTSTTTGDDVLLEVTDLLKHFPIKSGSLLGRQLGTVRAVDGVSLKVRRGRTLGLVGESGCGKSTLARVVTALQPATGGSIKLDGVELTTIKRGQMRALRRQVQMVFQDPYGSLNPRRRVGSILGEPFAIHDGPKGAARRAEVQQLLERVGLSADHYNRFPTEFSGGQRQRLGIARALALRPDLVVCDEPVSALDVSIQAQVLNLLEDLQEEFGLTYLFIAHDLSVVRHVSDEVAVMYLGKIVEQGPVESLYSRPQHPYTNALLSAVPDATAITQRGTSNRVVLTGDVPSPASPPSGCRFHTRCPKAQELCSVEDPPLRPTDADPSHVFACHFPVQAGEPLSIGTWSPEALAAASAPAAGTSPAPRAKPTTRSAVRKEGA
jgi:oligopeptide/dipeptide ABC transporter ATP-binding protein